MTRASVRIATVMALGLWSVGAQAQRPLLGGQAAIGSGFEAGDPGTGATTFRRARTRLAMGLDMRVDEHPEDGLGVTVFTEVEPHVSVGAELRYLRWLSPTVIGIVGATGAIAPHTLFGCEFGLQVHVPLDMPNTTFFIEPVFAALPLGTDLPSDRVLIWGLMSAGIHAKL